MRAVVKRPESAGSGSKGCHPADRIGRPDTPVEQVVGVARVSTRSDGGLELPGRGVNDLTNALYVRSNCPAAKVFIQFGEERNGFLYALNRVA